MPNYRLGDIIDDYCIKCRRVMNHAIVSLMGDQPAKVRCRTCYHEQDYRHEEVPRPKSDRKKEALFNEVLSRINPETAAPEPPKRKSSKGDAGGASSD